jgi:hypothetical protein
MAAMTSAVVMAGYNNKWAVRKYAKTVAEHYGEKFIETGYKPLREFEIRRGDHAIRKPLVQFVLESLCASDRIDEIVIVGHQMLLEQRLRGFIEAAGKPCSIVNQNTRLSSEIVRNFQIKSRKVKYNSIAGNMIKGYAATAAGTERRHALFVASDSPLTGHQYIDSFLEMATRYQDDDAIILPAVRVEGHMDTFGRYPVRLINDSDFPLTSKTDSVGRQGFRLSSLLFANPCRFDINTANTAYNLRKLLSPNIQLKLFRITRNLGYKNLYSKYFLQKDLRISEVENIATQFFHGSMKIIPVEDLGSSFDYDGTEDEFQRLTELLNRRANAHDSAISDSKNGSF